VSDGSTHPASGPSWRVGYVAQFIDEHPEYADLVAA